MIIDDDDDDDDDDGQMIFRDLSQSESLLLNTFSRLLGCGLFPFSADVSLAAMVNIIRAWEKSQLSGHPST